MLYLSLQYERGAEMMNIIHPTNRYIQGYNAYYKTLSFVGSIKEFSEEQKLKLIEVFTQNESEKACIAILLEYIDD